MGKWIQEGELLVAARDNVRYYLSSDRAVNRSWHSGSFSVKAGNHIRDYPLTRIYNPSANWDSNNYKETKWGSSRFTSNYAVHLGTMGWVNAADIDFNKTAENGKYLDSVYNLSKTSLNTNTISLTSSGNAWGPYVNYGINLDRNFNATFNYYGPDKKTWIAGYGSSPASPSSLNNSKIYRASFDQDAQEKLFRNIISTGRSVMYVKVTLFNYKRESLGDKWLVTNVDTTAFGAPYGHLGVYAYQDGVKEVVHGKEIYLDAENKGIQLQFTKMNTKGRGVHSVWVQSTKDNSIADSRIIHNLNQEIWLDGSKFKQGHTYVAKMQSKAIPTENRSTGPVSTWGDSPITILGVRESSLGNFTTFPHIFERTSTGVTIAYNFKYNARSFPNGVKTYIKNSAGTVVLNWGYSKGEHEIVHYRPIISLEGTKTETYTIVVEGTSTSNKTLTVSANLQVPTASVTMSLGKDNVGVGMLSPLSSKYNLDVGSKGLISYGPIATQTGIEIQKRDNVEASGFRKHLFVGNSLVEDTRPIGTTSIKGYWDSYPQQVVYEYVSLKTWGLNLDGFGVLMTIVGWRDASGGELTQIMFCMHSLSAGAIYKRNSKDTGGSWKYVSSNATWTNWVKIA